MDHRWQDLASITSMLSFPNAMGMGMGIGDISSHAAAAAAHYSPHYPYQVRLIWIQIRQAIYFKFSGRRSNVPTQPIRASPPSSSAFPPGSLAQRIPRWYCIPTNVITSLRLQCRIGRRFKHAFDEFNIGNRCGKCDLQDGARHDELELLRGKIFKIFRVCRRFTDFLLLPSSNQTHLNWTTPTMDSWTRYSPKRICCWQILIRRSMKVRVLRTWRDFCRHLVSRNISDCVKSLKSSKSYRYSESDDDLLFWAALLSNRAAFHHQVRLQELLIVIVC